MTAHSNPRPPGPRVLKYFVAALFVAGLVWRAAPLVDWDGRMMTQWPTEDGYFMLTMARNIALGHGMSVSGGATPTNGTQPLTTLIWSLGYALFGTDRPVGVLVAQVLQLVAALVTALGLRVLIRRVFAEREDRETVAWIAAGLWLASPVAMPHTMNCLETGFAGFIVVAVLLAFTATPIEALWSMRRTVLFGLLLGVAFWIRNDTAFLIAGVCVTYLVGGGLGREAILPRLGRVLLFGAVSVAVASPWLIYNYTGFGHIMPISGRAEALTGHLFGNLAGLPIVLTEYLLLVLPIPAAISDKSAVVFATSVFVIAIATLLLRGRSRMTPLQRHVTTLGMLYLVGMCVFYGVYFGAAWFLPRYFLPASPLLLLAGVTGVLSILGRFNRALAVRTAPLLGLLGFAVMMLLSLRQFRQGSQHPHFHVVAWVRDNVPPSVWVGAIQTGTLGFFHDRTVNLDGKVNPAALDALLEGREGEYVVEDTEIQFLADWVGMRDWLTKPAIAENFEVIVYDAEQNLAVLERRPR